MGSCPSIMFPPRLTRDEFRDLFTQDIYCDYIYEKLMNKNNHEQIIERKVFVEYAMSVKDLYILHDWGEDDLKRVNHQRVRQMIHYFETHGISCSTNEQREDCILSQGGTVTDEVVYRDHLDNSRVYLIAITKRSIDRIRGHGSFAMRDLLAQEFQYILTRKGSKVMIPVVMDVTSKNTMRWRGPVKQTFAPNKPSSTANGPADIGDEIKTLPGSTGTAEMSDNSTTVSCPFVCLNDDGDDFLLGMDELLKRVMVLLQKSCKEILQSRVFSRLKVLEGENTDITKQDGDGDGMSLSLAPLITVTPFSFYRHTYTRHTLSVTCMTLYGPSYLLSGSGDRRVHLWDRNTMEVIHTFNGLAAVHSLLVFNDHLFIAYTNRIITIWRLEDRTLVLTHQTRNIEAMIIVPTGDSSLSHLYTGHSKSFRRCEVNLSSNPPTIKETISLVGRDDTVYCAVLFQTHILFTGSVGNTIRAWDIRYFGVDMTIVYLSGHTGRVTCLLIRGTQLFSGSDDHTIRIWDIITLTPVTILEGHENSITSLVSTGNLLYSSSKDQNISIWNLLTNERIHVLEGHSSGVNCLAMDQQRLYSGAGDYTIKTWDDREDNRLISYRKDEQLLIKAQGEGEEKGDTREGEGDARETEGEGEESKGGEQEIEKEDPVTEDGCFDLLSDEID